MLASFFVLLSLCGQDNSRGWPAQLDDPKWQSHISYLRSATALAGERLIGPRLQWKGSDPVAWAITYCPPDMKIENGRIVWDHPTEGRYLVRVQAGGEEVDWQLNVLKAGFPDAVVHATRHMDYVVPRWYSDWMTRAGADKLIDDYFEFGRDLVGGLPSDCRQSILYSPSEGGAHSGDPIVCGNTPLGDNDVNHWRLGFLFHELGHNLNAWTRVGNIEHGDATIDGMLHDMVEFNKISWVIRMLNDSTGHGILDSNSFQKQMHDESMEWVDSFDRYMPYARQGGTLLSYRQSLSEAWAGFVHRYGFSYGADALANCVRMIRRDGIPLEAYAAGTVSPTDRMTELLCVMSFAANRNLKSYYGTLGFPINQELYDRFSKAVAPVAANLPPMGKNGAFKCPLDGHYYCLTPYSTTWNTAEVIARRLGGHLAVIRSTEQERWLANKFGPDGWMWLSYRRNNATNKWGWLTGETTSEPVWDTDRPMAEPIRTCAVLGLHEDGNHATFGLANANPNDGYFGLIELTRPPAVDLDAVNK